MAYQILKTGIPYKELGHDYFEPEKRNKIVKGPHQA